MSKPNKIKVPSKKEKITLRLMILLGVLSFVNFFYWFLNPNLIKVQFLFWLLVVSMGYDTLKIFYMWYHYWDISVPVKPEMSKKFSADVFTTYFPGEPYEMVKETLLAIKRIKYPHTTYLCDEANDSYLKAFCKENNIIHVTRNNRINAKAGNINNALFQAKGDICLILDPDHVPLDSFLDEVIPYFEDESIGFVQTVQAYYNVSESYVAHGAAEQTYHFYGPMMMTMNSYGTVNAIGANCVFRRKALDSIGGHAAGLSEDMHTAMQLHAKGWKSVYVPKVLSKGLVPTSLTSYYKQQLKWSRGTLELLVAVYPRLFKKFSWRQKLHFGILPLHYFSGIIYMINFLIPIISLFTAITPWRGNLLNFGLIYFPIFMSIIGIRFYVQRWVMHEHERGIHLTGGLLQACTWWIYNVGFIYTLIRRKVPYLPTPKEDKEGTNWRILIPNLIVGTVSIIALFYGLSIDYTPFSLFMSGFALINAFFMFYTLIFAYQRQKVVLLNSHIENAKHSVLNKAQNFGFHIWRKLALPIIVIVLATSAFTLHDIEYGKWGGVTPEVQKKHTINYLGVFAPNTDNGITTLKNVKVLSNQIQENFDIISFYVAWDKNTESTVAQDLMDSIYMQRSIPMITWEPWSSSFQDIPHKDKHIFELIVEGYFDVYISTFAEKLKNLQRPVFLRFAHEFGNPFYPWYIDGDEAPLKFKKAWIHTYEIFKNIGATNVIWIWNPWKSDNVVSFYPGKEYVDWIGVNILNYGHLNQDGKWHDFKDMYEPFHIEFQNLPATPVIISEFGTLKDNQKQNEWFENAFSSIENNFKEIKSVVYFNSKVDDNWPKGLQRNEALLDWTIDKDQVVKNSFSKKEVPNYVFYPLQKLQSNSTPKRTTKVYDLRNIKGINLKKGHDWRKDYHVLNRKTLLSDFTKIKRLGINTIKFEGNTIYEYNVLNIARECGLNISYGFWIPEYIDFVNDTVCTKSLAKQILQRVNKQKHCHHITSWNIQNDVQYNQKNFYHKPELLFQNLAYANWLKNLVKKIKEVDSTRPIIVDLESNLQSIHHAKMLVENIKELDGFGLVVKNDKYLNSLISYFNQSRIDFIYSEIDVNTLIQPEIFKTQTSFFITAWQDQHESNKLTFNGITDRKGRYKTDYFTLLNALQKSNFNFSYPKIRILRPAIPIYENTTLDYYAMYYDGTSGWKNGTQINDLSFEWSLIKCDKYGNYLAVKDIGFGGKISVKIPHDHEYFRLLLTTSKGEMVTTTITSLSTPIWEASPPPGYSSLKYFRKW